MHELALVSSLIDLVETHRGQHNFSKVNSIKLSFGELGGINKDCLKFAFHVLSEGTVAEGARLIFDCIPALVTCCACGNKFPYPWKAPPKCPKCESEDHYVSGGFDTLKLLELDVE